jgi:hypothetical protein
MVLASSLQRGGVGALGVDGGLATGELTLGVLTRGPARLPEVQRVELGRLVRSGVVAVLSATAVEVGAVVRWVGCDSVSAAELELVALVLAGRARLRTSDRVVMRLVCELGVEDRLVADGLRDAVLEAVDRAKRAGVLRRSD